MAKLNLSKSGLQKQREDQKLYQRVLPSLDLKRMQLMGELNVPSNSWQRQKPRWNG